MPKNLIQQFAYHSVLPHGEPVQLNFGILKDAYYLQRLQAYRNLIEQARDEFDKEIALATTN